MNQFCGAVLAAVANSFWPVVMILAVAWLGVRYAPRLNAATRHWIWWAVLAVIVAMPGVQRLMRGRPTPRHYAAPAVTVSRRAAPAPVFALQAQPQRLPRVTPGVAVRAGKWPARIFVVWLLVFLLQTGRMVWSYRYLRGLKRRAERASPELRRDFDVWMMACGVHRPAQLLISREIVSPMAVGFLTPAVIVPQALLAQFSESEMDHVLLHELAHLARRDDWSNLAARIGWALLVLHPGAAWTLRQIEREREIACDDWVVAATGEARPYAASLARLFELCFTRRRAVLATGMAERASLLGNRIEMLLRRRREFSPRVSASRLTLCAAVLLVFVTLGSQAPRWIAFAQEAPRPQTTPAPMPAHPPRGSFLAALVAAGYSNLPVDEIIALKENGISAEFLAQVNSAGLGHLSPRELIELHNNNVQPEYIREIRQSGLNDSSLPDAIELRNNGVDARYVREVETAGVGVFNKQQIIQFHQNGVPAELLRTLKAAGYNHPEPREIIELHNNGVGPRNFQAAKQYGPSLTLRQIIRLEQAGVI